MIEALDWLRSVFSTTRLRGGQAPVCWRKDLSRETASMAPIRRACDWVGEIAAISPKLRDEPLFGDCLADLTGSAEAPPQPEPKAAGPQQKRMMRAEETARTDPQKPEKGSRPSMPPRSESDCDSVAKELRRRFFRPDEVCPAQSVIRLRPEADRSLLRRIAGNEVVVDTTDQRTGGNLRKECDETRPVSPDRTKSHRDWLCRLAERAGSERRLQTGSERRLQTGSERRLQAERLGASNHPHEGGTPKNFSMTNVLADQLALPLDGPTISSQSLTALANERTSHRAGTGARSAQRSAGANQPSSSSLTARRGAELNEESRRRDRGGPSDWSLAAPSPDERAGEQAGEQANEQVDELDGCDETDRVLSDRIAPPSLAPALPALLPSQRTSQKVATSVSQNGAKREEAEAKPDDLNDLAEKIQRILNEEARRHGISV